MGDDGKVPLRLQFNPKIRLEFRGPTITSDTGLLPFRELDDALDLGWQGSDRNRYTTSAISRFETETLIQEHNLGGLARMNTQWVEDIMAHTPHRRPVGSGNSR